MPWVIYGAVCSFSGRRIAKTFSETLRFGKQFVARLFAVLTSLCVPPRLFAPPAFMRSGSNNSTIALLACDDSACAVPSGRRRLVLVPSVAEPPDGVLRQCQQLHGQACTCNPCPAALHCSWPLIPVDHATGPLCSNLCSQPTPRFSACRSHFLGPPPPAASPTID